MRNKKEDSKLVYSTDGGNLCGVCGRKLAKYRCSDDNAPVTDGIVRLQRQVKGRNGKPVVLVTGLPLAASELKLFAKKLKSKCGVGGSINGSTIIIQGDKRDQLKQELQAMGYQVKLSGG
ncbi:MAG: stress response translation initiation inhibitor YciH [Gammaproteobacteria bacterium]|jgi:translation initiation factor 1|nr:stress response translation initiation inhibitor YciH [Gammaproteobacteria bacterium]|tara:strand:- start:777 stop:1136 length:360 start_codon:yes stop_codon:yes gene_type:complete